MLSVITLLLALAASAPALTIAPRPCKEQVLRVHIAADTMDIQIPAPKDQIQLTSFITEFTSQTSNITSSVKKGPVLDTAYDIWTQLCVSAKFPRDGKGILEFAIHGINFDHSYWDFGEPGSQYNYVDAALEAGHAIFIYDRLSVGKSSKPDGIKEVQLSTEIEVAAALVQNLKTRQDFDFQTDYNKAKIVGVGHSFGSLQLLGLASKYGNTLDGSILTGFSSYTGGQTTSFAAFGLTIASLQDPKRFGSLSSSYLATEGILNDQMNFFHYPNFAESALQLASDTKATVTIGELLTQSAKPASNYTNPVFIVTGDKDFIFCAGNCYQAPDGSSNLIDQTKTLFPATLDFSTYIPADTGHAVNIHHSAPETYQKMQAWIKKRFM